MVTLTADMILKKTKLQRLEDVRNLNLFAYDISDATVLSHLPNVEVLSLSMNRLAHLKDFTKCLRLRELYLRRNQVTVLEEVKHLVHLEELKVLWLSDNPCADLPGYEAYVCGMLPQLQMLDNMCTAGTLREKGTHGIDCHIGEDGGKSVTVEQLEFFRAQPGTCKPCGQQTAANVLITTEANPAAMDIAKRHLGNHVDHADTMPPTCHGSISEWHARKQSVLQTVAKCDALKAEQSIPPQCTLVSLTSSNARISSSCFNVYRAVTHLLKELEDRSDWNALIALKHDIERRLDDTTKQECLGQ